MLGELAEDVAVDLGAGLALLDRDSAILGESVLRNPPQEHGRTNREYPFHSPPPK